MKFDTAKDLAKYTIDYYLKHDEKPPISRQELGGDLLEKKACFVTVYVGSNLRGCIGNSESVGPLYTSVIDNAIYAVRFDNRFVPVGIEELPELSVEVSVLSPPKKFHPDNPETLLSYLNENKSGVIIEKDGKKALFLPQVWEDLPRPEDFLSHLCLKGGLDRNAWREGCSFRIFNVSVLK